MWMVPLIEFLIIGSAGNSGNGNTGASSPTLPSWRRSLPSTFVGEILFATYAAMLECSSDMLHAVMNSLS